MTEFTPEAFYQLLAKAVTTQATDVHVKTHSAPLVRINGKIQRVSEQILNYEDVKTVVQSLLTEEQFATLCLEKELDISISPFDNVRFRMNLHFERGNFSISLRLIKNVIPPLEQLGLPSNIANLANKPRGLVLVTGPTGSGKTTTMASMIDIINTNRACSIITIEDPIEYLHTDKLAFVRQREVGQDTHSFPEALRRVLRQDPDVIVIGEMRDLETISTALTAAETGHLVIATLHTNSAEATINRIIDVYPPSQQHQVRIQLASTIEAILCQQLIPKANGEGIALAYELLVGTFAIKKLIREEKTYSIATYLQSGKEHGMISMDACLANLFHQGLISFDDALARCIFPEEFRNQA